MSDCKGTKLFSSTKVTPEQFMPVENYLKKTSQILVLHLRIDSFELRQNLKDGVFRFSSRWFRKTASPKNSAKATGTNLRQTRTN